MKNEDILYNRHKHRNAWLETIFEMPYKANFRNDSYQECRIKQTVELLMYIHSNMYSMKEQEKDASSQSI